ncbi:MAG: UDP-N-acetylglucosamine 1-carboxyvinyltransferase [bacterium]|nr:UDP-N-acetylglucosamine 1-carboxyvinyltransferase [bacterium]
MGSMVVRGGRALEGRVAVEGAKNSVLPILAASLLPGGPSLIHNVPAVNDVFTVIEVLTSLGARVEWRGTAVAVDAGGVGSRQAPEALVRRMRAAFWVLGPLLARSGQAAISLPGGCAIGSRPIDLHVKGLAALGADIECGHGSILARAPRLRGTRVYLDLPSVGATEHLMVTATLAEGTTIIENAAEEPEIVDLAAYLAARGARISGAGTRVIRVEGVTELGAAEHTVIPDRIEAGTFMIAAAISGGEIEVAGVIPEHLKGATAKLREAGVTVEEGEGQLTVRATGRPRAVDVKTLPYPGFPTDLQAPMMALMAVAEGTSLITETVFESRFAHVDELKRMGADIVIEGRSALVRGRPGLTGASVRATDIRAGAALILAALAAEGSSEVGAIHHLDRGYAGLEHKLHSLGADIRRRED